MFAVARWNIIPFAIIFERITNKLGWNIISLVVIQWVALYNVPWPYRATLTYTYYVYLSALRLITHGTLLTHALNNAPWLYGGGGYVHVPPYFYLHSSTLMWRVQYMCTVGVPTYFAALFTCDSHTIIHRDHHFFFIHFCQNMRQYSNNELLL